MPDPDADEDAAAASLSEMPQPAPLAMPRRPFRLVPLTLETAWSGLLRGFAAMRSRRPRLAPGRPVADLGRRLRPP